MCGTMAHKFIRSRQSFSCAYAYLPSFFLFLTAWSLTLLFQMGKPVNFATQEGQKQATPSKRKRSGDLEAAPAMLVPMQPSVTAGMGAPILPTPTAPPSLMGMPVSSEYAAMPESVQMTQQSEQALAQSLAAPLVPMGIAAAEYTGGAAAAAAAEPPAVGSTHDSEVAL